MRRPSMRIVSEQISSKQRQLIESILHNGTPSRGGGDKEGEEDEIESSWAVVALMFLDEP